MRIAVIGATGLIGSKVVALLEGDGQEVVPASRASGALIGPIAVDDVAAEVAGPADSVVNIGGPHEISFADLARRLLAEQGVDEPVVVDADATYFGAQLRRDSLVTV
ncbi:hypothetical protein A5724_16690 [Mycobacterium sp. ACS1612]|uniref:hypothetical protein n=1 Tax=Mycobacterium sp. ACS1612 TaxID=1834117 RepID=UPI0007FE4E85|nr:hypothetical protein [Mycobacterium sp. ACS1612]OBF34196.1 hypothetical protein A5724_16690 [Mycobacterium sp. ACS1612]